MNKTLLFTALFFSAGTIASPVVPIVSTPVPPVASSSVDEPIITPTPLLPTTTTSIEDDDCSTRTVCIDGVNECGQGWGTCIPDCQPWSYDVPPCTTFTPPPGCEDRDPEEGIWLCKDFIDPCHQMYGGCYDVCKPEPTWYPPPCDKAWPTDGNIWGDETETPEPEPEAETELWAAPTKPLPTWE